MRRLGWLRGHGWAGAGLALLLLLIAGGAIRPAPPAGLTRGPYLQLATETGIVVLWNTAEPSDSVVDFGIGAYTTRASDAHPVTRHAVRLAGLAPGTRYLYRVASGGRILRDGLSFTTAKPAGSPIRFAVFGDSGSGERGQYVLGARVAAVRPDFVLHVGDIVYPAGAQQGYDARFFRPYAALLQFAPIWPVLGNHDLITADGRAYYENFVLPRNGPAGITPQRCFSFEYADAHFVGLDSDLSDTALRTRVAPWLRRDLAASDRRWKFVYFHHPPYSSALHGENPRIQRILVPVLQAEHVDVVYSGHDHDYERITPLHGVQYIVTGAGGGGLYAHKHPHAYTEVFYNKNYSFTLVDINGGELRERQVTAAGKVIDQFITRK